MKRYLYMLLLCTLLAGLVYYGKTHNPAVTLAMCMENPAAFDGQTIFIGTEITVREVREDGFQIHQMGRIARVYGESAQVKKGDTVQLVAQFRAPDQLVLEKLYVAKKRRWKIALSVVPVVLIAMALISAFEVDGRRFEIVERGRCRTS